MQAQVVQVQVASNKYPVQNGVKQGCVLASTLFSIYLGAMLKVDFTAVSTGEYIQTSSDANLVKIPQFKTEISQSDSLAETRCLQMTMWRTW